MSACDGEAALILLRKSRTILNSHALSILMRALVSSSEESKRFFCDRHAFLRAGPRSNCASLDASVCKFSQMAIETNGAHSFRMASCSRDLKAVATKLRLADRTTVELEGSSVRDNIRRKRREKRSAGSVKIDHCSNRASFL